MILPCLPNRRNDQRLRIELASTMPIDSAVGEIGQLFVTTTDSRTVLEGRQLQPGARKVDRISSNFEFYFDIKKLAYRSRVDGAKKVAPFTSWLETKVSVNSVSKP